MLFVILVAPLAIDQSHCINLRVKKITRTFHHYLKKLAANFFKFQFMSIFAISCNRQQATGERLTPQCSLIK